MNKPFVRSWDVFDTLITRRCGSHTAIFEQMGATLGEDFRKLREQAEIDARSGGREIGLDDIYDQLRTVMGWSAEDRQRALDLELSTEAGNVIPVAENLSRVRDGDVLVSDMYLSHDFILGLVRAAGLTCNVTLFVTNNGKGDGSIWRKLRSRYVITRHTGDDPVRDFLRPWRHGVPAVLTDAAAESPWERTLRCNGVPALSAFVREMRLRTVDATRASRALRSAQIEANFPLLLLASAALLQWCTEHGITRALMASRDCILWAAIAAKLARHAGQGLEVEYFLISRVAALKSSEHYLAYAAKRITPSAVVVDLSMTGVSLAGLADRLGITALRGYVIAWHQSIAKSLYGARFQPRARVKIDFLLAELPHNDLEAFNQALTPSIHDVTETADGLAVTYASENRPRKVLDAIGLQNAAFATLVEHVPDLVLSEALAIARSNRSVFLVRECERRMGSFDTIVTRASPGAALANDPNGITLNLPYATRNPVMRWFANGLKRVVKPLMRPGSPQYRYGKILPLVLRALKAKK